MYDYNSYLLKMQMKEFIKKCETLKIGEYIYYSIECQVYKIKKDRFNNELYEIRYKSRKIQYYNLERIYNILYLLGFEN